jgi:hypothetical protein
MSPSPFPRSASTSTRAGTQDPGPPPNPQSSEIPQFRNKDTRTNSLDKQAGLLGLA